MLDKLALTSPEFISLETACKQLRGQYSNYTISGSKYHHSVVCFKRGTGGREDFLITLHLGPRFSQVSPMKLEMNPTRFGSFKEVQCLVSQLTDPDECRVTRIDHTVDLPGVSVQHINQCLTYSRKKSREVYKNGTDLTGLYLGKNPELLVVYDKAREQGLPGPMARIELRQYREKVPEQAFNDLPNLIKYQPFSSLKFQRLKAEPLGIRETQKKLLLQEWLSGVGAQGSFKALNRHSNFKRDFQPLFETDPEIPNLDELYQQNLITFFREELA